MARRNTRSKAAEPEVVEVPVPPYYEATQDIYLGHPDSGAMPVAAYRTGDQVHPGVVEEHNLGGAVKIPDVFGGGELAEPDGPEVPEGETPAGDASVEIPPDAASLPEVADETPAEAERDGE